MFKILLTVTLFNQIRQTWCPKRSFPDIEHVAVLRKPGLYYRRKTIRTPDILQILVHVSLDHKDVWLYSGWLLVRLLDACAVSGGRDLDQLLLGVLLQP